MRRRRRRAGPAGAGRQRRRRRASPSSSRGSATGRADRRDRAGGRGAAADRRLRPRDRRPLPQRARARPRRCSAGSRRPTPRRRPSRSRASTRSPARSPCGCRRRGATTRPTRSGVAGAAAALGRRCRRRSPRAWPGSAGVGRRLERKGEAGGVVVYDDYGHHPTAIRETLAAVRQREPGRRVWAVYEPLTYHRTAALLDAFAEVLAAADAVAIADIWAGRDPDTTIALGRRPGARPSRPRSPAIPVAAPGSVEATAAWLAGEVRPGDAVLVMGGGRSYRIGELLLAAPGGTMTRRLPAGARPARGVHEGPDGLRRGRVRGPVRGRGRARARPVRARARRAQRAAGILARGGRRGAPLRSGRSSGTGSRATRSWPHGTPAGTGVGDDAKVRQAGFLSAEVGEDGRIGRLRLWTVAREHLAG